MVALAIGGILLGIALPAFNGFMTQSRMTSEINDFVLAVNYARSEAIKLGGIVSLRRMDTSSDDDEWGGGYCVSVGNPANCDNALRIFNGVVDSTFDTTDDLDGEVALSFNGRGLLTLDGNGSVELCSVDENTDPGRIADINNIGRVTVRELICNP